MESVSGDMATITVGILTVSDTAFHDSSSDKSGPALVEYITRQDRDPRYEVIRTRIVQDDQSQIQRTILEWADDLELSLIVTTGGTGFAKRDITPEAVETLLTKKAPSLAQAMVTHSLSKTPLAVLARPVCGVRNSSLVVTLPGSPKGAIENLEAIMPVLSHALQLINGADSRQVHSQHQHHHSSHYHHVSPHTTAVSQRLRKSPFTMVSVTEAVDRILEQAPVLEPVDMKLDPSRMVHYIPSVLSEDVVAAEQVPGYPASIVDGYAVISSDGPGKYPVIGSSSARASSSSISLKTGEVMRITTGAPIPRGADAVVMVEDTLLVEDEHGEEVTVEILTQVQANENIRQPGSDAKMGDIVGRRGEVITAAGALVGTFASVGIRQVRVYRKPIVALLSTGNELISHLSDESLQHGQIRDSNRPALRIAIQSAGFQVIDLGISGDTPEELLASLGKGLAEADVIVSTGGVSMGELDLLKPIIQKHLNGTIHFGRVNMKPGKPTTFATIHQKLIFALPGNPASAIVTFHLFVLPALWKMMGLEKRGLPRLKVKLAHAFKLDQQRPEYHRAVVSIDSDGVFVANSTGFQRSSRILSLRGANALLELPSGRESKKELEAGRFVDALIIDSL